MLKRLLSFIMCFTLLASTVASAEVWSSKDAVVSEDLWTKEEAPQVGGDTVMVLVSAFNDSKFVYYNNEYVRAGLNLYDTTLRADLIDTGVSILDFQVAVSSWLEVGSIYFVSSNEKVVSVSVRLTEEGTHIFTLIERGNGSATISLVLNDSEPVEIFRINVGKEDEKKQEIDYNQILAEALRRIPDIFIVDKKENIVSDKVSAINVGESDTYRVALGFSEYESSQLGYSFYNSCGYYFFVDTDRIKWTASGSHVTYKNDGYGITLTGISAGEDLLKAEVPVSVAYLPDALSNKDYYYVDKGDDYYYGDKGILGSSFAPMYLSEFESWDIGTLSREASIRVIENKVEKKAPYNPFTDIDLAKVKNPFSDVTSSDWYYEAVMYLYAAGILNGVDFNGQTVYYDGLYITPVISNHNEVGTLSTSTASALKTSTANLYLSGNTIGISTPSRTTGVKFNQSNPQNRQNSVVQLYNSHKSIGYSIGSYTNNPFNDVKSGVNSYQPILWASSNGIIKGYGNGKFGPYDHITREQFCAILVRHANIAGIKFQTKYAAKNFTDNNLISSWASNDVVTCQRAGIIQGYPDGSFRPQGDITNAEMCAMIMNYLNQIP